MSYSPARSRGSTTALWLLPLREPIPTSVLWPHEDAHYVIVRFIGRQHRMPLALLLMTRVQYCCRLSSLAMRMRYQLLTTTWVLGKKNCLSNVLIFSTHKKKSTLTLVMLARTAQIDGKVYGYQSSAPAVASIASFGYFHLWTWATGVEGRRRISWFMNVP
jgi:hypothetical protein